VSQERYCVYIIGRYPGQVYELWEHDHSDQANTWQVYPSTKFCQVNQWLERYDSYSFVYLYSTIICQMHESWEGGNVQVLFQ